MNFNNCNTEYSYMHPQSRQHSIPNIIPCQINSPFQPYPIHPHYSSHYQFPSYDYPHYSNIHPMDYISEYEFRVVGHLYKKDATENDSYKILVLYGKCHREGFYKYFVEFNADGQIIKKVIHKGPKNSDNISREIYDGDIITLNEPFNSKYTFEEQRDDFDY
jgi:hypothetical protein